jgi:hypothetical protein
MNKPWLLALSASQILYFPTHVCLKCGATSITLAGGDLYEPFCNLFGADMEYDPYFGYVRFDCACHLNMSSEQDPHLAGSLRVARVGDALLPVSFVSRYSVELATWGMHAAQVNNARVHQAVQFLAAYAIRQAMTASDPLKALVYAVSAGQSPERAYLALQGMILGRAPVCQSIIVPTEVDVM